MMHTVSVRALHAADLFDPHDPAPLGERRLHPDVIEYILGNLNGMPSHAGHLVVETADASPHIEAAVRRGLQLHVDALHGEIGEVLRVGYFITAIAAIALTIFLVLAYIGYQEWGTEFPIWAQAIFIIVGWVIIWRPADALLFDWCEVAQRRRRVRLLLRGKITLRRAQAQGDAPIPPPA